MPGAADDKKQGGNGNDPDEASKLKEVADGLTKLAQEATKGITKIMMTENIKSITVTNICQADNAKKGDTKSTKDSAGSSGPKKSCKHTIISNTVDLCAQELQKRTEEEDFAEAPQKKDVSR